MGDMRRGWFVIPSVQTGDVTLEDQMIALWPAVAEAKGKSVLDVGCAEGLIGREFARAGAATVTGIDSIAEHLRVAAEQCTGFPMTFVHANLNNPQPEYSVDIVLALGVNHKLRFPEMGIRFAARSSRDLVLLRSGRGAVNGVIYGKYSRIPCDSHAVMRQEGFELEKVLDGPPARAEEKVEYWRRRC